MQNPNSVLLMELSRHPLWKTNQKNMHHGKNCNDMVLSWIFNSLTPDIIDSVILYDTAHEVWEDLQNCFSQSHAPHIFQIERDITCLTQDQMIVATYYTKLKKLWDELGSYSNTTCTCEVDNKRHKLMQFIMGLNDSYNAICGQILLMNPCLVLHRLILPSFKKKNNDI